MITIIDDHDDKSQILSYRHTIVHKDKIIIIINNCSYNIIFK